MSITELQISDSKIPIKGTESYKKLLQDIEGKFSKARQIRLTFERQWYVNLAYYFGRQYVQWSSTRTGPVARLYEPSAPPWRVRMVINQVRSYARKELAKVTKEDPVGFVLPASGDEEDLLAARAGDAIIEHLWREKKMKREIRRAAFWAVMCGTGFIKDWYDEGEGEGECYAERISPFHILVPDVQEEEIENQPWLGHEAYKNPEWVEQRYGKRIPAGAESGGTVLEQKFLSAMGIKDNSTKDMVHVKEMWVKPNAKYPEGMTVVWAGEEILHLEDGWPYSHKEYPFSKIDNIPTGRFYGESIITDLLPLQKELNRTRSQIIESKNRMSKPQLVAAKGSIDVNKITSEPGLCILYTPGFQPPTPLPLQNLPNYVVEEVERIKRDFDDLSSQHEVSRGQTPSQVTAATAISYLQEQDDLVITNCITSLEEACEKLGRHFLFYVNQYWDQERKIRVIGYDGQFEAFEFSKANLNGNTDYVVQAGSGTPRSQAAKQAFIMELGKMGWIPPDRALRYLQMAETGRLYEEMQIDARQQQRENMKMSQGIPVTVNTWDNDLTHIYELDNYRKKQSYETLDEQKKTAFEEHARLHKFSYIFKTYGMSLPPDTPPLLLDAYIYGNLGQMMGAMNQEQGQVEQGGEEVALEQ